MDQYHSPDSADTHTDSIPLQPYRVLSDIPPPATDRSTGSGCSTAPTPYHTAAPAAGTALVQVMRVLFIQLVAPLIILPAPRNVSIRIHQRQHYLLCREIQNTSIFSY